MSTLAATKKYFNRANFWAFWPLRVELVENGHKIKLISSKVDLIKAMVMAILIFGHSLCIVIMQFITYGSFEVGIIIERTAWSILDFATLSITYTSNLVSIIMVFYFSIMTKKKLEIEDLINDIYLLLRKYKLKGESRRMKWHLL